MAQNNNPNPGYGPYGGPAGSNNHNANEENNDDAALQALLLQAQTIIDAFDESGEVDYQEISNIIHELSVDPDFDELAMEGSEELAILRRLQQIRQGVAVAHHAAAAPTPAAAAPTPAAGIRVPGGIMFGGPVAATTSASAPRRGMRYNAALAAAGAGENAWVPNTSKGGRRKSKKTRKANKSRKTRKGRRGTKRA